MPLFDKPLSELKEADLAALISDQEPEGKTLDYKRDLVAKTDEAKREFLYDVTSFANTAGGHLIFGIDEDGGIPTTLNGISGIDADAEILRLEQIVRDGVRPAIIGFQTSPVRLSNGNTALVLRIPKSWNPPHQVTFQKAFRFYARASNGKYQLDVDELRQIFALSATAAERLKHFRVDRIAKIVAREVPVVLDAGPLMVLHVLPLGAFAGGSQADLHRVWRASDLLVGVLGSGGTHCSMLTG